LRYAGAVEATAYFTVAEAVDEAARRDAAGAAVTVGAADGRLVVTVVDAGSPRTARLMGLADRVGALGGTLVTEATTVRVELPCG
jgi:hypothetical protein